MSNLQIYLILYFIFQTRFPKSGPKYRRRVTHGSLVKHPSGVYKHDIKESEGNMFNPKIMSRGRDIQKVHIYRVTLLQKA